MVRRQFRLANAYINKLTLYITILPKGYCLYSEAQTVQPAAVRRTTPGGGCEQGTLIQKLSVSA